MSDNTYGSYRLHVGRLIDIKGKHIKEDTLFLHIYDYWTNFHNPNKKYFWYHESTMSKFERHVWKKWVKFLPDIDVMFERIKAKDERFDPLKCFDREKYFESLFGKRNTKYGIYKQDQTSSLIEIRTYCELQNQ